mgnify:CR=1 FL=1
MNEIEKKWCADTLADLGHSFKRYELLLAEASHRSFYRLYTETNSLVFMISPPSLENNSQFIKLSKLFVRFDLPVPEILYFEAEQGYFLLHDLGTTHFENIYGTSIEEPAIKRAISALYEVVGPRVLSAGPGMIELARNELAARRALFVAPTGRAPARRRVATNGPFGAVQRLSLIHISEPTRLLSMSDAVFCV